MKNKNEDGDEEKEKTLFVDRRIGMNFHSFIHFTDHFQKKKHSSLSFINNNNIRL